MQKRFVPFGAARIKRGLRANRDHGGTRSCHRIGGSRVTTAFGAVKDHVVVIVEKAGVDQLVEILVDGAIPKPGFGRGPKYITATNRAPRPGASRGETS